MFFKNLLFTASIYSVLSDDCVKYTFEDNFELFSNDLDGCKNHQGLLSPWTHQTYTDTTVPAPNEKTDWLMSPSTSLSCISSFPFTMESGGIVEVHVYIDPTEREDHLAVMVHQIAETGSHPVVGMDHLSGHNSPGWYVMRISVAAGVMQFNGYITFLGVAYPGSVLIVDSFRYFWPSLDLGVTCILYQDDVSTTDIPTTIVLSTTEVAIPNETTSITEIPTPTDTTSTTEMPTPTETTSTTEIPTPTETTSTTEIPTPTETTSTTEMPTPTETTPTTEMPTPTETTSTTEMPTPTETTSITEIPTPSIPTETTSTTEIPTPTETTSTTEILTPTETTPTTEIPTPSIPTETTSTTEIPTHSIPTEITSTTEIPTPSIPTETTSKPEIPTPSTPTDTTSITEIPTPSIPTETTLITEIPTPTIPPITETIRIDCVKYSFDKDFEELFTENEHGCTTQPAARASWSLQAYGNDTIEPPNVQSKYFITPSVALSCTSSFYFPFMQGGLLEVLTYYESTPGNSLDIYVHAPFLGRVTTLTRVQVFTPGWQIVTVPVNATGTFPMHLTFTGSRSPNSFVIVDSFRYVAPSLDPEECDPFGPSTVPTTTDGIPVTTTDEIPMTTTNIPTMTTTDIPTMTTTDIPTLTTSESNNPLEKIIIIKKKKTIRTESTFIKKIFRFN